MKVPAEKEPLAPPERIADHHDVANLSCFERRLQNPVAGPSYRPQPSLGGFRQVITVDKRSRPATGERMTQSRLSGTDRPMEEDDQRHYAT